MLGRERFIANAETLGHSRTKIFHDDISGTHQRLRLGLACRRVQIDHDGLLAAIPGGKRRVHACRIPLRLFHLDDLGTLIGQQHTGQRSGNIVTKIDDAKATECTGAFCG
jgi:hypothetical protein